MPTFKYIKYSECPDCGKAAFSWSFEADSVYSSIDPRDRQIRQHVNGGRWESVEFLCGRKDEFVPNFDSIQVKRPCQNTPVERAKVEKRKAAEKALAAFILSMDVDNEQKLRLLRNSSLYNEARQLEEVINPPTYNFEVSRFDDIEDELDEDDDEGYRREEDE